MPLDLLDLRTKVNGSRRSGLSIEENVVQWHLLSASGGIGKDNTVFRYLLYLVDLVRRLGRAGLESRDSRHLDFTYASLSLSMDIRCKQELLAS